MSDDNKEVPLRGEELKVAKRIQKIIKELDGLERDHPWFDVGIASIHIDFAIRGVRCNGHQRINSFIEVMENFETLKESLIDTVTQAEKSLYLINKAQGIYSSRYKRCTKCGGKGGAKVSINDWADCYDCDGNGYIPIPIPPHIPKVQHKLYEKVKERKVKNE